MAKLNKFDGMMHEFCVGKGFCGSAIDGRFSHVTDFIPKKGQVTAEQFAEWILKAESLHPEYSGYKRDLVKVFKKHMGSNQVDASLLS